MEKIRFLGDIHGDLNSWKTLIQDCDKSIQVGDFGAGFVPVPGPEEISLNHKFIRGNHDAPYACKNSPRWIADGTFDPTHRMFFMGGAFSIDYMYRKSGISWWEDEELSSRELYDMVDKYMECSPEIMVTHDCPSEVSQQLFSKNVGKMVSTRTGMALQAMFENHKPRLWIFGHYHIHRNEVINNTRFICCDINQAIDIDLPTY